MSCFDLKTDTAWLMFGDYPSVHPTQKPVALLEYLIKTYTNEGETVLDNTSGSGTLAEACINTGRNFIIMEKNEIDFKTGIKRIKNTLNK